MISKQILRTSILDKHQRSSRHCEERVRGVRMMSVCFDLTLRGNNVTFVANCVNSVTGGGKNYRDMDGVCVCSDCIICSHAFVSIYVPNGQHDLWECVCACVCGECASSPGPHLQNLCCINVARRTQRTCFIIIIRCW